MRLVDKKNWLGLGIACTILVSGFAFADSVPEEKTSEASVEQFGGVETAPAATAPAPCLTGNCPQAVMQVTENASQAANGSDQNFPKVQTPEDKLQATRFDWWPSDASPGPVKDQDKSGYWWWPDQPGTVRPWGNQGYVYVRKIIFDYKTTEGPMKPSLIIKRILKNVRVFFDYDKADIRDDAAVILDSAVKMLGQNEKADILITGNADVRGSEQYNEKLGERRADAVKQYFTANGVLDSRVKILSRGKMDAMAPKGDIVGMQKDRNAQFMVAEVEEVMIPADKAEFFGDKVVEEKKEIEGEIKVGFKDYEIQAGDSLWKIAEREYGNGRQWKRIYEFNKDVIANPDRPRKGTKIRIPIE